MNHLLLILYIVFRLSVCHPFVFCYHCTEKMTDLSSYTHQTLPINIQYKIHRLEVVQVFVSMAHNPDAHRRSPAAQSWTHWLFVCHRYSLPITSKMVCLHEYFHGYSNARSKRETESSLVTNQCVFAFRYHVVEHPPHSSIMFRIIGHIRLCQTSTECNIFRIKYQQ